MALLKDAANLSDFVFLAIELEDNKYTPPAVRCQATGSFPPIFFFFSLSFRLVTPIPVIRVLEAMTHVRPEIIHEVELDREEGRQSFSVDEVCDLFAVQPPNLKRVWLFGFF